MRSVRLHLSGQRLVSSRDVDRFFNRAVGRIVSFLLGQRAKELSETAVQILGVLNSLVLVRC